MSENWKKLEHIMYESKCLWCKRLIRIGQPAWWLKNLGLLHDSCGLGSNRFSLSPVYKNNPTYEGNPFENSGYDKEKIDAAKDFRESEK
jgi:hypothetical protein